MDKCVFCKIAKKEIKTEIVDESDNFIAFLDKNPMTPGHSLVIPKEHYLNLFDLPSEFGNELLEFIKKISQKRVLKDKAEGINLLMRNGKSAGQEVEHAHIHIIPRKKGDGVRFLPV